MLHTDVVLVAWNTEPVGHHERSFQGSVSAGNSLCVDGT